MNEQLLEVKNMYDLEHTMDEGRLLAILRPTGAGEVCVTAKTADCGEARVQVAVTED